MTLMKKDKENLTPKYMSSNGARPPGNYMVLKGEKLQHAKVSFDKEGNPFIEEDEVKKTELEVKVSEEAQALDDLIAIADKYTSAGFKTVEDLIPALDALVDAVKVLATRFK